MHFKEVIDIVKNSDLPIEKLYLLIDAGGPVIVILLAMSILAITVIFMKLWQFQRIQLGARGFIEPALTYWRQGQYYSAEKILVNVRSPIARVMETAMQGIRHKYCNLETAREEVTRVAANQLNATRTYLKIIEVIATTSPLLGLLGTVFGMIEAFKVLEAAGTMP